MDTEPISIVRNVELSELFFRFWADHKVCKYAVPISATPHYEMAKSFRAGHAKTDRYKAYIDYAASHYREDGRQLDTVETYLANLTRWVKRFDLVNNPIEANTRNGITFIVAGGHRAAYALAAGYHRVPVRISAKDKDWGWEQDVQIAQSMESVPGNYVESQPLS